MELTVPDPGHPNEPDPAVGRDDPPADATRGPDDNDLTVIPREAPVARETVVVPDDENTILDEDAASDEAATIAETVDGQVGKTRSRSSPDESRSTSSTRLNFSKSAESETHTAVSDGPRYDLVDNFAHGGVGNIWKAHDQRLQRNVAYKELLPRALRRPRLVERFVQEAQITGQLEHPGIVPIYDLGWQDNGAPFYAMKLINGTEMKDRIGQLHKLPKDSVEYRRAFVKLLHNFIDTCNALAFAHQRGVLHRDLKPQDVMLGEYGETLVLDWGLARILTSNKESATGGVTVSGDYHENLDVGEESADESLADGVQDSDATKIVGEPGDPYQAPTHIVTTIKTSSRSEGTETRYGSVMGTLAYMPPEQAEGKIDLMDARTDIYSLGAILYEILVNDAPIPRGPMEQMIDYIVHEPIKPPIEIDSSTSRQLNAIALKALSKRREDRFASALDLAQDVEDYLAGEPVSAYPEPWYDTARRWARRHQKQIAGTIAAIVFLVLVQFAWSLRTENQQLAAVEKARSDVAAFEQLADEAQYFAATSDRLDENTPYYDPALAEQAADAALKISAMWGKQLEKLPIDELRSSVREPLHSLLLVTVQSRLQQNLDEESTRTLQAMLERAAALNGESESLLRLQAAIAGQHSPGSGETPAEESAALTAGKTALDHFLAAEELRRTASRSGNTDGDEWNAHADLIEQAIAGYRAAIRLRSNHFWSHFQIGRCYLSLGRYAEGVETLGACIALRPESPWSYSARGLALAMLQRYEDAITDLNRAIELDASFLPAKLNLGVTHWMAGNIDPAVDVFTELLQDPNDPQLAEAAYYRASIRWNSGDTSDAISDLEAVLTARPGLAPARLLRSQIHFLTGEMELGKLDLNLWLASTQRNVMPATKGDKFDADNWQACFERARFVRRLLSSSIPEHVTVNRKGLLEFALTELQAAITQGGKSADLFSEAGSVLELMGAGPDAHAAYSKSLETKPDNDTLLVKRGWLLALRLNRPNEAIADFEAALRVNPENAEAYSARGFLLALGNPSMSAERAALQAILHGAGDYLILHNVACIYAELAARSPERASDYEQAALDVLSRGLHLWQKGNRSGPNAIQLARHEPSFRILSKQVGFLKLLETAEQSSE